jgi:hypothetical protein
MAAGSSNPTTNLKKVAGTAVAVNTGNADAGTQRIVIASNQPNVGVSVNNAIGSGAYVRVTDGTNTMPAGDAASRGVYHRITDGTNTATVKAASTAALATDQSLVVTVHPSSAAAPASQSGTWTVQPGNTQNTTPWYALGTADPMPAPIIFSVAASGSFVGSISNGTYYFKLVGVDSFGNTTLPSAEFVFNNVAGNVAINFQIASYTGNIPGIDHFRLHYANSSNGQTTSYIRLNSYLSVLTSLTSTGSAAIPSTTTAYGSRNKELSSVTDPYNSHTSNLSANGNFSGIPIDISEFAEISVAVYASHSSASNGLQIQFSQDAVSWDVINTLTITSNVESGARFPTHLRYFRVIYTNGATTTSTFRLQTRLHRHSANGTLRKFNDSVLPTDFAQLTRSVLNGRNTPTSTSFSDVVVKAASTAAAATDTALVIAVRDALPSGSNTIGNVGLVAGSNAIGKLSANDGVDIGDVSVNNTVTVSGTVSINSIPAGTNNIGDVDVLSLPALATGSNTIGNVNIVGAKVEDAAATNGDTLIPIGVVRQDTIAGSTTADGDYTWLKTNSVGRLWTSAVIDSALPTGTNNIGDVDIASWPALASGTNSIGTVGLNAGSNTIGNVGLVAGTSTIGNVVAVSTASSTLVNSNSTLGAVTGGVIKNSAGNLFLVSGYNNSSNNIFVQLHNATSAPAEGVAPVVTFSVPANSNYSFDWGSWGRYFSTGIYVCGSSTFATKTIITIGTIWVDAQFK